MIDVSRDTYSYATGFSENTSADFKEMPLLHHSPTQVKSNRDQCDLRYKTLDITLKRNRYQPDALIEVLHKAQESFGYLEEDILRYIARQLKLPLSRVYGVASFYHLFDLEPSGAHRCIVCLGTACYVKGAGQILEQLETTLRIKVGETTPDGQISLLSARCLGACGIAPAVVLDDVVTGRKTPEAAIEAVQAVRTPVVTGRED